MYLCNRQLGGHQSPQNTSLPHDAVKLKLRDLRTLEGALREWIANGVLGSPVLELLDEFIVDALLHVDSGASTAALAVVEEDTKVHP